jgi:hypothetical protein
MAGGIAGSPADLELWCSPEQGQGFKVEGQFVRQPGFAGKALYMYLRITNVAGATMNQFALMLNKNSFAVRTKALSHDGTSIAPALSPMLTPSVPGMPLAQGRSVMLCVQLDTDGEMQGCKPLMQIQVAMKVDANQPAYFAVNMPLHGVYKEGVVCEKKQFMTMWQAVPAANEQVFMIGSGVGTPQEASAKLEAANFVLVHSREDGPTTTLYAATQTTNNLWVLLEMPVNADRAQCKVRVQVPVLTPFVESSMTKIISGASTL